MPHFILEYSDNILEEVRPADIFPKLHELLINNGPFKLSAIKSRAIVHKDFYVADGNVSNAFVHLTLSIFKGRALSIRQTVGKLLLEFLKKKFARSCQQLRCGITVEIREINTDTYFKVSSLAD
jgi:5-carboxymethyl-2-hydroxymuconate isomerase